MKKTNISLLSEEQENLVIRDIIDFFATHRGEEIGIIAAQEILDMLLESAGNTLYNKGVEDTKAYLEQSFETIKIDIDATVKR